MAIVTDLFQVLGEILTGLLGMIVNATSGIIPIFYDASSTTGKFTIYGVFLLIGLGLFFVMFAWRVIQGFIRK